MKTVLDLAIQIKEIADEIGRRQDELDDTSTYHLLESFKSSRIILDAYSLKLKIKHQVPLDNNIDLTQQSQN